MIYNIRRQGVPKHWTIYSEAELPNPCLHTTLIVLIIGTCFMAVDFMIFTKQIAKPTGSRCMWNSYINRSIPTSSLLIFAKAVVYQGF